METQVVRSAVAQSANTKSIAKLSITVLLLHVVGWLMLFLSLQAVSSTAQAATISLGTGVVAYLLGLRHAFDADHITAIDNTSRKLLSEGKQANSVGLFFSLGHSTVVFAATILIAIGFIAVGEQLSDENSVLRQVGGLIGGLTAGLFLILIAFLNILVFNRIMKAFMVMRSGVHDEKYLEEQLNNRGFMSRFLKPVSKTIDKPWKMYPLGVLFGLGFDTASSVALLVLAGTSAIAGHAVWAAVALPIIFAAGMSLGDTVDAVLMNKAYGWAYAKPVRKAYYNIVITFVSISAAFIVGVPILANVITEQLNLTGPVADFFASFDLENVGFVLVGVFMLVWIGAVTVWKFGRIEERWEAKYLNK